MARIDLGYNDYEDAPAGEDFEPYPAGGYHYQLTEADIKQTKNGGRMFAAKAQVIEGPCEKRVCFLNINLVNQSTKAQEIGQREFANLCKALGLPGIPDDTSDMLYKPFYGDTVVIPESVDKASGKVYRAKNQITKFKLYGGGDLPKTETRASTGEPPAGTPSAAVAASAGAPKDPSRPWVK